MKNYQILNVKAFYATDTAGSDEFAVHPILQTLAFSTQKELILVENKDVTNKINWENERRRVSVISLNFRTDGSQIVAILADGRALVVDEGAVMELDVAEISDTTVTAAEWTADEQTLALADNNTLYLSDPSLVPFVERPLHFSENDRKSAPVNVGWGSESTQFRGSAGKLKPGESSEKEREILQQHSKRTSVHWRWDGEIVAVSFYSDQQDIRNMAIFDRNGEILNMLNIRNIYLSHCFAHKPNANLLVSSVLEKDSDDRLVFYERNGETRNSYVVKYPRNHNGSKRCIERIEWNSTGLILAIQISSGIRQTLEFWNLSNYEFTRKYNWTLEENEAITWKWSTAESQNVEVLLGSGQFFSIHLGLVASFSDTLSQNVVVSTDELRMYSLCRRVVPPPMSDYSIQCPSDIVAQNTSARRVHVITTNRQILSYSQDIDGYKFDSDRLSISADLPSDISSGLICGFVFDELTDSYIVWSVNHGKHIVSRVGVSPEKLFESDNIGWIGVNPFTKKVEIAVNDGHFLVLDTKEKLFRIEKFEAIEVHFTQNRHVILADSVLYIDSSRVSQETASILTRQSDILLIDFDNKLRFVDVETAKALEDVRDVEAGCELVACDPNSANVVLQAARGNLETIQPRRYVMAQTRELLDRKDYIPAFKWMKKHRVDMSFAMTYKGDELENDVGVWLKSTSDSALLEQLIVSCTEVFNEEGSSLCTAIHQHIQKLEDVEKKTKLFPLLLTSLLRSKPVRINDALKEIQEHVEKIETRKDVFTRNSLHHISFFVPAKELFNCALSTYDLKLAQQVAEASNYDPKEYLPVLNKLNRIPCVLERRYRINVVRGAWVDAIASLLVLDSSQERGSEETWWNDTKEIIERENLHQNALTVVKPGEKRYKGCCEMYAIELEKKIHWKEAAMFYEIAGNSEKTLKCWEMSRDVDGLVSSARRLGVDSGKLKIHAIKMSAALREGRQPEALAKALKLAGSPSTQVVQALCDAFEWTAASREVEVGKEEGLRKAAAGRNEQLIMDIERKTIEFEKYRKRLVVVRENKLKRVEQYAAGEVDDLRDDGSVISSISSRSGSSKASMASTVRRRKQIEKKKGSLKEGGEYEDSALLNTLAEHYRWLEQVGKESSQLIPVLMAVGHFGEAIALRKAYDELALKLQKSKAGIWPENLSIQHLPGPLYALFDPNLQPSLIPMPPLFRLEPELIAPASSFPSVFP
ncbi:unnamed protein product [Caenorhabditis sp. 36 PRJEB53466]|nr:unnamed protein product [Caenorhabditis sp. 36 PRJEB53466]